MAKRTMPAIEVQEDDATGADASGTVASYECAFHILPTIADEEVPGVVEGLKALVTRSGGTVTDEEVSERYDLVYEIVKQVDGVSRRFNAAHFGWLRFMIVPAALGGVISEIKRMPEILRHVVVRLTKEEAQRPFSIFEARRTHDREGEQRDAETAVARKEARGEARGDTDGIVSDELLNESLEKITTG